MKLKEGVNIQGLDIRARSILVEAEKVWKAFGQELWITSGMEGTHSAGSLHYYGLALDFRIRDFYDTTKQSVFTTLKTNLQEIDKHFDVVLESNHIHAEYDVFKQV